MRQHRTRQRKTNFVGVIKQNLGTEEIWKDCLETTHQATEPEVKGSKGLRSAEKTPEAMLKGVLRHRNGTSAFRDGTIRFDMVDITMDSFSDLMKIGFDGSPSGRIGLCGGLSRKPCGLGRPKSLN